MATWDVSRKWYRKRSSPRYEGNKTVEVELFTWEKLDYVDKIKAAFWSVILFEISLIALRLFSP